MSTDRHDDWRASALFDDTGPTDRGRRLIAAIRAELAARPDPWIRYRGDRR